MWLKWRAIAAQSFRRRLYCLFVNGIFHLCKFLSYLSLGVSFAKLLKLVSRIARYASSSLATIYLKDHHSDFNSCYETPSYLCNIIVAKAPKGEQWQFARQLVGRFLFLCEWLLTQKKRPRKCDFRGRFVYFLCVLSIIAWLSDSVAVGTSLNALFCPLTVTFNVPRSEEGYHSALDDYQISRRSLLWSGWYMRAADSQYHSMAFFTIFVTFIMCSF